MIDALSAIENGMHNDLQRMHSISNNLANVSTPGFKRETVVLRPFNDHLSTSPLQQGHFIVKAPVPRAEVATDFSAGTLKHTGNALDVAIDGEGFFEITTAQGVAYTRQGNLRIDSTGKLVTVSGVDIGTKESEVRLNTSTPVIDLDGQIWDGQRLAGTLRVVQISNPETLDRAGQGLYFATSATLVKELDSVKVRQGYLEAPNVQTMMEMVQMLETVRHFEASQKVIQGYDTILNSSINVLADNI